MKSDINVSRLPQLILQQRLVHHITSLCIRNMTIRLPTSHDQVQIESYLYFTLHTNTRNAKDALFKSDVIPYSPNPTWLNFEIPKRNDTKLTSVAVRLWIGKKGSFMPALQWEISLKAVRCIGEKVDNPNLKFHSNSVVIKMHKSYYTSSYAITFHSVPSVFDFSNIKKSYSVKNLHRIISISVQIQVYKSSSVSAHNNARLMEKSVSKESTKLKNKIEDIQRNISHLNSLLRREKALLSHEKATAKLLSSNIEEEEKKLTINKDDLHEDFLKLQQFDQILTKSKNNYYQIASQLALRRHALLTELSLIFPIVAEQPQSPSKSAKKVTELPSLLHSICTVNLRDSESFRQRDDSFTSIALGYTAQLVVMISYFLMVPLRYPIVLRGSSSKIIDLVTENMSDRDRLFPLSVKGKKHRFLFDYGVFLLNKNVAFLRFVCGLGTADIRRTLENIKTLLEERLGTKILLFEQIKSSESINLPRPRRLMSSSSLMSSNPAEEPFENVKSESASPRNCMLVRMDSNAADLAYLRKELFGHKLVENREDGRDKQQVLKFLRNNSSKFLFEKIYSRKSSSDSMSHQQATYLTGLEPSSPSPKEAKISFANAKAELLGRRKEKKLDEIVDDGIVAKVGSRHLSEPSKSPLPIVDVDSNRSKSGTISSDSIDANRTLSQSSDTDRNSNRHDSWLEQFSLGEPEHMIEPKTEFNHVIHHDQLDEPDLC